MGKLDDILAQQAGMRGVLQEVAQDTQALLTSNAAQMAEIQALKDQLAQGGVITEAMLDPVLEETKAQRAQLEAIAAAVPTPSPQP